jgi:galactoside O-acetyltransferase
MGRFDQWERPEIIHNVPTKWNWVVAYPENLVLGDKVDIGCWAYIQAQYGVEIGDQVQIGGGVKIYSANTEDLTTGKIIIKKLAKIGANSVILPGVCVGTGARVGALTLVRKDVPDWMTVKGVW